MSKSKRLFVIGAILFFIALFYASYDISKRTSFPGSKPQLQERLKKVYLSSDSAKADSIK
jgi:hypothetical protein